MPDVILKDRNGDNVTYRGVTSVQLVNTAGELVTFSEGQEIEGLEIPLDLSEGDQHLSTPEGFFVKEATIKKPNTLIPANIVKDVDIAGVVGTFSPPPQAEKTVVPDFSTGDMTIVPDEGTVLSKITVSKPETLVPENIAKGVEIAGVEGNHAGSGGSSIDAEALKYFVYQVDDENNEIIIYGILYSALYAETGSYDVYIPDTIGDYSVIIAVGGVE